MRYIHTYMNHSVKMLLVAVLLSACSLTKKPEAKTTAPAVQAEQVYRFKVSFISKGSGIDTEARRAFLGFLEGYRTKDQQSLRFETSHWGREGETDFCLPLTELTAEEQAAFIVQSKELLKDSTLVRFAENSACKGK